MSISSDSAEQLIKLYFDGAEFLLKISGSATKHIIAALYVLSKEQKVSKGKTRLNNMLKSNKELKVFSIKKEDMKIFAKEAKSYGVLYCVLANKIKEKEKSNDDVDIMVRADDAPMVNRIINRFNLTIVENAKIVRDEKEQKIEEKQIDENILKDNLDKIIEVDNVDDQMVDDIFGKSSQKDESSLPLTEEMQKENLSENFLENKIPLSNGTTNSNERKSVKNQLAQYKVEELENEIKKQAEKTKEMVQPITALKEQLPKVSRVEAKKEKGK